MAQHMQINKLREHLNRNKNKNQMLIATDAEKFFDKIQHHFMTKALRKVGIEGMYFFIIKVIYNKPIAKVILNGEKLKLFLLNSGMRKSAQSPHCYST
jgi:hypothetical protein